MKGNCLYPGSKRSPLGEFSRVGEQRIHRKVVRSLAVWTVSRKVHGGPEFAAIS